MALKFVKSLLQVENQQILYELVWNDPFKYVIPIIEKLKDDPKSNLNMIHSAAFEFLNNYTTCVLIKIGEDEHKKLLDSYQSELFWARNYVKKLFNPKFQ